MLGTHELCATGIRTGIKTMLQGRVRINEGNLE